MTVSVLSPLPPDSPAAYSPDTRDTRHLEARSAPELLAWLQWLELGGFRSGDAYERTCAVLMNAYPQVAFGEFRDHHITSVLIGFPAKSRRIRKAHLNNWFAWGYRTDRIVSNPVEKLPTIKRSPQPHIDIFTEAEQAALEALPLPDGPLMTLLFEAGLRQAEAINMRVKRIDFRSGEVVVKEGAKRGKDRTVPIMPNLAGAMDRLITEEGLGPDDYLWYDKPGGGFAIQLRRSKPIAATSFGRWWYRCLDDAGVEYQKRDPRHGIPSRGNPHTARHTFATRWSNRGLPIDRLSKILGHASEAITADIYVHTSTREIGEEMRTLLKAQA